MASLIEVVSNFIKPYKFLFLSVFLLVIFIVFGFYVYRRYSAQLVDQRIKDFTNTNESVDSIDVILFHVDWCPHCKKALPDWASFSNEYNGKIVNGYKVNVNPEGTNCTDDSNPHIVELIKKHNIQAYPTVIIMKDGERYDFDAKITRSALDQFVETVCNANK
jgi:thiol-disulfide isomerase/thioredoxin